MQGKRQEFIIIDNSLQRSKELSKSFEKYANVHLVHNTTDLMHLTQNLLRIEFIFISSQIDDLKATCEHVKEVTKGVHMYVYGEVPLAMLKELFKVGVQDVLAFPIDINKITTTQHVGEGGPLREHTSTETTKVELNFDVDMPPTRERIIVVGGVKGGDGKSLTAVQIGAFIAKQGQPALLIDADPNGNVAQWIGGDVIHSIAEFNEERSLDREILESRLLTHQSTGLKVLASPINCSETFNATALREAILAYKPYYSAIIVDLPQGYNTYFDVAKEFASDIVLVTTHEKTRIERLIEMMQIIDEKKIKPNKINIIINQIVDQSEAKQLKRMLEDIGYPVFLVPFAKELHHRMVKELPAVAKSKSSYSIALNHFLEKGLYLKKQDVKKDSWLFWLLCTAIIVVTILGLTSMFTDKEVFHEADPTLSTDYGCLEAKEDWL